MKNKLIEKAKEKNILIEISTKKSISTDINILNDNLKSYQVSNLTSYCIKAIKNNKSINIMVENIDNTDKIINDLETIFELQENDNKNRLCKDNISNKLRSIEELDYNEIKNKLLDLNRKYMDKYHEISSMDTYYSHYDNRYKIENDDSLLEDECFFNEYATAITVKKGDISKVLYISLYTNTFNLNEFDRKISEDINRVLIKLDSDSCKTNKYKIILKNDVAAGVLNTFSSMFDSKMIDLKESVLQDKFNKQVFSKKLNIVEDPNGEGAIIKRIFDGEGVRTSYKDIIKDGIFVKKINNLEYAIKNNEEPTGNSYGVNNLYIKPGKKTYEELIKELDNGIIIDELIGFHAGVDIKSGNISLQAEGLLVENGSIVKGLSMIILSTNIFELWNNIVEIGNDLSNSSADVNSPSLLIDNITITGKKC